MDVGLAVDAQLGDEDAEEGLGLLGLALCEHLLKLIGDGCEIGRCGRVRVLVAVVGKLGLLGAEVVEAGGEVSEALLAALGGEASFLEGVELASG
ncbi:MAG TPA: hypothetical protein VGX72_11955 [Solirubrobacteraceae bacterium]|nr:hypothetical protein [Solirubrobacteraceae bacterium]